MSYLISLVVGLITGIIFSVVGLPIPAPGKLEGVLGIIGIFLGYVVISLIKKS